MPAPILTEITPIATVIDLNGPWASGGVPGPVILEGGSNAIIIDMSAYQRPTATGSVVDNSHISVNFPDDKTYTATIQPPDTLVWSNNSSWTKVPRPIQTLFDLNGQWSDGSSSGLGPVITVNANALSVDMSEVKRPNAQGSIINSSFVTVTFPDDKTYTAALQPPATLAWSNQSTWTKIASTNPGDNGDPHPGEPFDPNDPTDNPTNIDISLAGKH